jgi:vacuolar-type H+-ATPase subunit E/Vma4
VVEGPVNEKHPLITGIESKAQEEAEKVIKEAEAQAAERKKYLDKQVSTILREAEEKARVQADFIKSKTLSGVDIEIKRKKLNVRDRMLGEIQGLVKKNLEELIAKESYREVLINWISEAMIGLGAEHAFVNASVQEKNIIDESLLAAAEKKVKIISGRRVKLELSGEPAALSQGVFLMSGDGRTAFDNRVSVRLLRKQREINTLIYKQLFGDV